MLTEVEKATYAVELSDFVKTNEARAIVILKAVGFESSEIQHVFNLSIPAQEYLLTVPELKQLFDTYDIIAGDDDESLLQKMGRLSLRVKARLLKDESTQPAMRNSIATEFLDRVHGKARQMIEQRSVNINIGKQISDLDRLIAQEANALGINALELEVLEENNDNI